MFFPRFISRMALLLVLVAVPVHSGAVGASETTRDASATPTISPAREAVYDELSTVAAEQGWATAIVMIEMEKPLVFEGDLEARDRDDQRARISSQISAFVGSIDGLVVDHTLTTVPGFVGRITPSAIEKLRGVDHLVASIQVDRDHDVAGFDSASLADAVAMSEADVLHEAGVTGKDVTIAVIDEGVDSSSPRFADGQGGSRVTVEACFSEPGGCPNGEKFMTGPGAAAPSDPMYSGWDHGILTTTVAAANGDDFVGVAPDADIAAVKISKHHDDCPGTEALDDPCVKMTNGRFLVALDWLTTMADEISLRAVNYSAGVEGFAEPCTEQSATRFAVQQLLSLGVVVTASAGNSHAKSTIKDPACIPEVISVGAGDTSDHYDYSNNAPFLDFVGPVPDGLIGTSFSAPHVAAAYALLLGEHPDANVLDVTSALKATGFMVADSSPDVHWNTPFPQLDAANSLLRSIEACEFSPETGVDSCDELEPQLPTPPPPSDDCEDGNVIYAADDETHTYGTDCDDVIYGTSGDDVIFAGSGDDVVLAGGGKDVVYGGWGEDEIDGGSGVDVIYGDEGNDTIDGGHNPDIIKGGMGDDVLVGGTGADQLIGGYGSDELRGGEHGDSLDGGFGSDQLNGGIGDDQIIGGASGDTIHGDPGNDWISAGAGNDFVFGDLGRDTVSAGNGDDVVNLILDSDLDWIDWAVSKDFDVASGGAGSDIVYRHLVDFVDGFELSFDF